MKILVEYDHYGDIKSIGAKSSACSKDLHIALRPRPGHYVAEVNAPDVRDEHDHEHLLEIKRRHRIETNKEGYKLVRR